MEKLESQIKSMLRGISAGMFRILISQVPGYCQDQSLFDYVNSFESVDVFIEPALCIRNLS